MTEDELMEGAAEVLLIPFWAWLVMLLVGSLHSEIAAVPTVGYAPTLIALVLLRLVKAAVFGGRGAKG